MVALKELYFSSRLEWRNWLKINHTNKDGIWFVFFKKHTGKDRVPYEESVEEALCFGWIDSLIKKIDNDSYARKFTKRKDNSQWSESNKKRIEKLIAAGVMTELGMKKIAAARKNGRWSQVISIPDFKELPIDFKVILDQNDQAKNNFINLAQSYRRQYIGWIDSAKRAETRNKRIAVAIDLLEKNKKLGIR